MPDQRTLSNTAGTLNERAQHLLKALVERHISDGQPVGSRTLSRDCGLELSPATIRNVMADLEDFGFVRSPHTSAGRVPTVRGYRFFVDSLLQIKKLNSLEIQQLQRAVDVTQNTTELVQSVSMLLSGVTRLAGLVMLPRHNIQMLRHIEFLPLSRHRVLVILVLNEHEVHNRIIDVEREFSAADLQQASNLLNERFAGRDLLQIRNDLLNELQATRESMNALMETALAMAGKVFENDDETEDYVLQGQTNLMNFAELADMEKLRQLFEAFSEKREILHLLDRCIDARGVQIFIGEESGYQALDECSVVTAPYTVEGKVLGVLGVIGPTRMAYERVIPIVDVTARLLSSALNSRS